MKVWAGMAMLLAPHAGEEVANVEPLHAAGAPSYARPLALNQVNLARLVCPYIGSDSKLNPNSFARLASSRAFTKDPIL